MVVKGKPNFYKYLKMFKICGGNFAVNAGMASLVIFFNIVSSMVAAPIKQKSTPLLPPPFGHALSIQKSQKSCSLFKGRGYYN